MGHALLERPRHRFGNYRVKQALLEHLIDVVKAPLPQLFDRGDDVVVGVSI